jgi:DNA-binding MarR family transcriptional regulator
MARAVAEALETLLAADRLLERAKPVGLPALTVLFALKAGPARPKELAAALRSPPGRVHQRLLRLRRRDATSAYVQTLPDGHIRLTPKGHRFVNAIAALAYHANRTRVRSQL